MSLYGDYLKSREGKEIIEDENGFAVYSFGNLGTEGSYVYLSDIYVVPEKRKLGLATSYADEVARIAYTEGVSKMIGSVDATTNGATDSLKILLAYGMRLSFIDGNVIYFEKEICHG